VPCLLILKKLNFASVGGSVGLVTCGAKRE
jgi:hypothetical protein